MKRATFLHGAVAAAVLALLASIGVTALTPIAPYGGGYQLLAAALALAYLLYLLALSKEQVGRITTLSLWAGVTFSLWFFEVPAGPFLLAQVAALWLVRSLYFYSSGLSAVADLALNLLAVATACWAAAHTGSVFLTTWCFFLVQALFVAIPPEVKRHPRRSGPGRPDAEKFERARCRADQAIRQLFAQ